MQELSIATFLNRARQGWLTPLVFALVLAAFALMSLVGGKPVYRVTMTVVPAPSDQSAQIVPGGALTSLLGLGTNGGGNYFRYQRLLYSTVVAQRLQDHYGMLQSVFQGNWDPKRKVWIPTYTWRDYMQGWLLRLANVPVWTPPDVTALAGYLQGSLIIIPTPNSDLVTISMDHRDVEFAKHVMLAAHEQANLVLRDLVASRSRQQVAYLEGKLAETSVQDYRATLLAILANEQKNLMLTQTDASFAAEILSPPVASPRPISPRPVLSLFVAMLVGALSGLAIVVFLGPQWWRMPIDRLRSFLGAATGNKSLAMRR